MPENIDGMQRDEKDDQSHREKSIYEVFACMHYWIHGGDGDAFHISIT